MEKCKRCGKIRPSLEYDACVYCGNGYNKYGHRDHRIKVFTEVGKID